MYTITLHLYKEEGDLEGAKARIETRGGVANNKSYKLTN